MKPPSGVTKPHVYSAESRIGSRPGAGVFIEGATPCGGTISNCFFNDNQVGIALIGEVEIEDMTVSVTSAHTTSILFNTIAYNEIGVYSGSDEAAAGWNGTVFTLGKGVSIPALMNNVIESTTPQFESAPPRSTIVGASAFEGLDLQDMSINGLPPATRNSNAFDSTGPGGLARHSNDFLGALISWPPTQWAKAGKPSFPRVNIATWSGAPNTPGPTPTTNRGVLYINDAFREAGLTRSLHDFRIAPMSKDGTGLRPANPLIGTASTITRSTTVTMANGTQVVIGLVGSEPKATLDALDWDCDGFGNPRFGRKGYDPIGGIMPDIGADEANSLIISGFLDDTRMFSSDHPAVAAHLPSGSALPTRTSMFFFDFHDPKTTGSAQVYLRPWFNLMPDLAPGSTPFSVFDVSKYTRPHPSGSGSLTAADTQWYSQVHVNPYIRSGSTSNYTDGGITDVATLESRFDRVTDHYATTPKGYPEFMRNLHCDISPHLFPSIPSSLYLGDAMSPLAGWWWLFAGTPAWGTAAHMSLSPFQRAPHDWEQANPWFKGQDFSSPVINWSSSSLEFVPGGSVEIGLLSPPGTCPAGLFNFGFLWFKSQLYDHTIPGRTDWRFNPWDYNLDGIPSGTYTVGVNGIGDLAGIDVVPRVPGSEWHGLRVNLEQPWPGHTNYLLLGQPTHNIQTALIVQGQPGGDVLPAISQGVQNSTASKNSSRSAGPTNKSPKQRILEFSELIRTEIKN